jgi:signal transduction histidine kinase
VLFDIFLLFRKRKVIAKQELELKEQKIDELILKNEVENINSLLKGQKSERHRISKDLHDRLGGILFTAKLYHSNIESKLKDKLTDQTETVRKLALLLEDAVEEVRKISHDLYAGSLAGFNYSVATKQLAASIQSADSLKIIYEAESEFGKSHEELQYELYAITQELLSNTLKHARATEVEINMRIEDDLIFQYHDNGRGFDTHGRFEGIGLKNIRSRIDKFGGKLSIESSPQKGSYYFITIPLRT